jgi:hypothetical protein
MSRLSRFEKFENTSLYQNCNECISWDKDIVDPIDMDKYNQNKDFILTVFNCAGYPSEDQMDAYINDMECIDDEDRYDFQTYITIIFEKSFETHHACKELVNKNINNERKNKEKNIIKDARDIVKEEKQIEVEKIKEEKRLEKERIKKEKELELELYKEQKRLEKEHIKQEKELLREEQLQQRADERQQRRIRKKEDFEKYNTETITCYCGIDYIRNKRVYHMRSTKHEDRMECLKWILSEPEIYKKYSNNTIDMDDGTISSLEN